MCLLHGYSKWSEDYYQQNCNGFYIHDMNIKFHLRSMKFLVFKSHLFDRQQIISAFLFVTPFQILWCQLECPYFLKSNDSLSIFLYLPNNFWVKGVNIFFVWLDHLSGCLEVSENSMKESKDTLEEFSVQSCLLCS